MRVHGNEGTVQFDTEYVAAWAIMKKEDSYVCGWTLCNSQQIQKHVNIIIINVL